MLTGGGDVPALGQDTGPVLAALGLDAEAVGKAQGATRKAA
jgi:hypothetical protein